MEESVPDESTFLYKPELFGLSHEDLYLLIPFLDPHGWFRSIVGSNPIPSNQGRVRRVAKTKLIVRHHSGKSEVVMYKIKPQWRGWATPWPKNCSESTAIQVHMDPGDRVTTLSFFMFCAAQLKDLIDNKYKIWYNKMGIIFFFLFWEFSKSDSICFCYEKISAGLPRPAKDP